MILKKAVHRQYMFKATKTTKPNHDHFFFLKSPDLDTEYLMIGFVPYQRVATRHHIQRPWIGHLREQRSSPDQERAGCVDPLLEEKTHVRVDHA